MENSEIKLDETEKSTNKEEGEEKEIIIKEFVKGPSEEEDEPKKEPANHFFELQLGDVIKIYNPKNEVLDNNTFLINYIDETKIELMKILTR